MGYEEEFEDAANSRSRENALAVEREHALAEISAHPLGSTYLAFFKAFRVAMLATSEAGDASKISREAFDDAFGVLAIRMLRAGRAMIAFENAMIEYLSFPTPEPPRDREPNNG